jgi:hypothetical protein
MSSITIAYPPSIDAGIREMCSENVNQAVDILSKHFGFDAEEAHRILGSEIKFARKRGNAAAPKASKPKAKAKAKDPDAPKKPKTGWLLYCDSFRAEVQSELIASLAEGEKQPKGAVITALSVRWKGESDDTKNEWKEKAKSAPIPGEVTAEAVWPESGSESDDEE